MIGVLFRSYLKRWQYYVSQLKKKNVSKLKIKFEYEYLILIEVIRMSINNLFDELREIYEDFVVFYEEFKVFVQVFCIFWDEEVWYMIFSSNIYFVVGCWKLVINNF